MFTGFFTFLIFGFKLRDILFKHFYLSLGKFMSRRCLLLPSQFIIQLFYNCFQILNFFGSGCFGTNFGNIFPQLFDFQLQKHNFPFMDGKDLRQPFLR